jgi:phosphate starvation-inducible membrane PsiE
MLNLTLGFPSRASLSVKFSVSPMLMLNLAVVESKKDYSVQETMRLLKTTCNRYEMLDIFVYFCLYFGVLKSRWNRFCR